MLDFRSPVILGAAPVGLAVGALAWFVFDGGAAVTKPLDELEARANAAVVQSRISAATGDPAGVAIAAPLFALTTGPGAVALPSLQLQGVAISPHGQSALVAIGGKPPAWLDLGATQDGVTVIEVRAGRVLVDTAVGFEDLALGVTVPGSGPPSLGGPGGLPQTPMAGH